MGYPKVNYFNVQCWGRFEMLLKLKNTLFNIVKTQLKYTFSPYYSTGHPLKTGSHHHQIL